MAKRGYKIQEFVAHSSNVNCLNIGKKACRLFITGGDDYKVNLWTIGKPTSLMSLSGHTSPVESVAFNTKEVLVLGGASSGVIRLWDLEEGEMVRTVAGHRSNCTAVEFHPFGEFFASGAMDTNLKLWDIRKKGCIHTYKGHSQGISTIKFTPDGRWVVSGGLDNVVKVWDLTAGKLLHDFNFHDGPIRSLDFHPLEFLLATGSADKTVKFWDLETFEMIGSARREATGVRSIAFHPDGRTLFSGHEDGLKVFSWEPVICHDTVDMGWTTLGDLCIHDEKLLGCSFFRNSVGVWVADISLIEPYGDDLDLKKNEGTEQKHSLMESKLEKVEVEVAPTSGFRSMSPDESKEIKNIYIDSSGGKPIGLQRSGSVNSARVDLPEESKEICNLETTLKQNPATKGHVKSNEQATRKSFIEPNIVPRDIPAVKDSAKSGNETITFSKTKPGMLLRPAHIRRASTGRFDVDRFSDVNSGAFCDTASKLDSAKDPKFQSNPGSQNEVKESCEDKHPIKSVADDKFDKTISPYKFFNLVKRDGSSPSIEETSPVKYVNGVAVVRGRTRSLVERFERKEKVQINEDETNPSHPTINETGEKIHKDEDQNNGDQNNVPSTIFERRERITRDEDQNNVPSTMFERKEKITRDEDHNNVPSMPNTVAETRERVTPNEDQNNVPSIPSTVFESRERITCNEDQNNLPSIPSTIFERRERITRNEDQNNVPSIPSTVFESRERITRNEDQNNLPSIPSTIFERRERITRNEDQNNAPSIPKATFDRRERIRRNEDRKNVPSIPNTIFERRERSPRNEDQKNVPSIPNTIFERRERIPRDEDQKNVPSIPNTIFERRERIPRNEDQKNVPSIPRTIIGRRRERTLRNEDQKTAPSIPITISEIDKSPSILKFEAQASPRDSNSNSPNELGIIEALMQTHDVTLSTLRSRLTKLQVVRHFWERNDTKGAINALRKLSDQSVRADVISVLVEKMDVLTLDLVSSILPVLTGLLDGKIERHVKVSLDMLLKLVAVFGPTINATVSAPPSVGVDLHREQRRECCNECFMQLQKVQTVLPILIRRGGLLAKSALELNLVLQQS